MLKVGVALPCMFMFNVSTMKMFLFSAIFQQQQQQQYGVPIEDNQPRSANDTKIPNFVTYETNILYVEFVSEPILFAKRGERHRNELLLCCEHFVPFVPRLVDIQLAKGTRILCCCCSVVRRLFKAVIS